MPLAIPSLVSGLRVAAPLAPLGAVVGEWVGASGGLGFVMVQANARMQTDTVFAAMVILAILTLILRLLIDRLTSGLAPGPAKPIPHSHPHQGVPSDHDPYPHRVLHRSGKPCRARSSQAADKLSVLLEWFVNPDHAPMVIAQQRGLFADAKLDVELIPPSDPSAVPRLVSAGQADIGIHYQPNLYLDHEAGLPLMRFGTLVETPLNTVTVLADGPIKSLKDLKGKKVGFSVTGFEDAMLKRMLASEGLSNDDVELINVNFSLSPSLIGGKVDATLGGFRNFELTQMKLEGHQGRAFYPEEHGVPAYDEPDLRHSPGSRR